MKSQAFPNAALAFLLSSFLYSCFAHVAVPMDPTGHPEYDAIERRENFWLSIWIGVMVITAALLTAFLEYRRTKRSEARKTEAQ
ncbi:MAG: hypothetical protein ACKV19_00325 [Verrucomicrobiales bacterium]